MYDSYTAISMYKRITADKGNGRYADGISNRLGLKMDDNINETNEKNIDYSKFEELFFENVRKGKKYQHFLNLSSQLDCMLIRSILASMKIPTYVEGENMNKIYGGASTFITTVFKIKLYILIDDYDEAFIVVKDYIKNKRKSLSSREGKDNYLKAFEILSAPYIISNSQEILGISIMGKKTMDEKPKENIFFQIFNALFKFI